MYTEIEQSFLRLKKYCEEQEFRGYDPYDGLNSRLFRSLPLISGNRIARLAWIQVFKRSPVNFRSLAGVGREYNPKALGLFLSGYCNLYAFSKTGDYRDKISWLSEKILDLKSPGWSGACWGYNFDWQARAFFQPKGTPTVVASVFVGNALLDAYDITKDEKLLSTARSTCDFILKDLNRTYDESGNFAFSYSPLDRTVVFNASLLGCRLLSRVYSYTSERHLIEEAEKAVRYCCKCQQRDGSWSYGTLPFHQWIDNFHTGYNLECIAGYQEYSGDRRFAENLNKGFEYYINTFFTDDGVSRYYSNKTYPVDIHAPAQLVITLEKTGHIEEQRERMEKVLGWTINNMQSRKGYFYFQLKRSFSSKVSYMRWAQAWMFYAMSSYLKCFHEKKD